MLVPVLFAGIIAGLVVMGASGARRTPWIMVAAAVGIGVVVVAVLWTRQRGRRLNEQRHAIAEELGLTVTTNPGKDALEPFRHLSEVPRSAKADLRFTGEVAGRPVTVIQASHMVHTGQTSIPIMYTIYATDAPAGWPDLHVVPRGSIRKILRRAGLSAGIELDDARFNSTFRVTSPDEDFAVTLLDPAMQSFMLDKTTVRWHIGRSQVCLAYHGVVRVERMAASLERMSRFWELVPVELDDWETTEMINP